MSTRVMLFALLATFLLVGSAYAFDPAPGNRAYPIVGRDMLSGKTVSLEEQRGKWVLLSYWASW